jgi:transcriptional regulator with XRE-family HTH domain
MIDAAQIRAARAILDWNQAKLCKAAGIKSINTLGRIESGNVTAPHHETIEKIQRALEAAGIEFIPRSGVRKRDIVEIYEGEGSQKRLIDDIHKTLIHTDNAPSDNREILIAHLKEDEARENLKPEVIEGFIRERRKAGITHRLLVRADDQGLFPPTDTYRILPDQYFSNHPLYIYGSKLAILAWDPEKSVVIDDKRFADCARKLFNFIWDHTKPISRNRRSSNRA